MFTSPSHGRSYALRRLIVGVAAALVVGLMLSITTVAPASAASSKHAATVKKVLSVAKSKKGKPYRWGASGPKAFDCSGYTRWVYKKVGVKLPHSSKAQVAKTKRIKKPRKGDLVFFHSGGRVYHVGIYAGKGKIWHAPNSGGKVRLQKIWTKSVFYGDVKGV